MKRIVFIAAVALGIAVLSASSQSIVTKAVEVAAFDEIVAKGKFDVKYFPGEQSVKLCGPQKALDKFTVNVVNGVLTLDAGKTTFIRNDRIVVYIGAPSLKSVRIEGAGDFEADRGISAKDLELTVAGAGDIEVKRIEADNVRVAINGAGDIDLEYANCDIIDITVNGAGSADLEGIECRKVKATINGAGSAELAGHAKEADVVLNGAGSLDISELRCDNLNSQVNGIGSIKRY